MQLKDLERGTQVAHIPHHAAGEIRHKDVEFGFVTGVRQHTDGTTVFCRFWSKSDPRELRTKANSESCDIDNLIRFTSALQKTVDKQLERIEEEERSREPA